jgi:hypothetical protein
VEFPPQQVGIGDDPDQPSLTGEGQVVDAPVDHGEHHLAKSAVVREGVQRRGHDLAYRCVRIQACREHTVAEVGGGHQAGRPAVDDQRRHQPVAHAPGRLGDRVVRGAGDDRPAGQRLGSDPGQILLRRHLRRQNRREPIGRRMSGEHPGDLLHGHSIAPSGRAGPGRTARIR